MVSSWQVLWTELEISIISDSNSVPEAAFFVVVQLKLFGILAAILADETFLYRWNRLIHNSGSFPVLPHQCLCMLNS